MLLCVSLVVATFAVHWLIVQHSRNYWNRPYWLRKNHTISSELMYYCPNWWIPQKYYEMKQTLQSYLNFATKAQTKLLKMPKSSTPSKAITIRTTKSAVIGYMRNTINSLKSCKSSSKYGLFQNIPDGILCLIALFYQDEQFQFFSDRISIIELNDLETDQFRAICKENNHGGFNNKSFGIEIHSQQNVMIEWHFQVFAQIMVPQKDGSGKRAPSDDVNVAVRIGIASTNLVNKSGLNGDVIIDEDKPYYMFNAFDGIKESWNVYAEYGQEFGKGHIMMRLDLKEQTLEYATNGKSHGIAFDDVKKGQHVLYRLCVSIADGLSVVKLENFVVRLKS